MRTRRALLASALLLSATRSQVSVPAIPANLLADFHEGPSSSLLCLDRGALRTESLLLSCASTLYGRRHEEETAAATAEGGGGNCELIRDHVYFHGIFDFQRPSSTPLFVNQICRALSLCIAPANFRIVLHVRIDEKQHCGSAYLSASRFLDSLSIPYTSWTGEFDTMSSQQARLVVLRDLQESTTRHWILQVDADELPVFGSSPSSLGLASLLQKMQASTHNCDVVYGWLSERVSQDGRFVNITLSSSLDDQFPLICDVKEQLEKAQSRKLVLYRTAYRAGIGNHRLICEQKSGSNYASQKSSCAKIFDKRSDLRALHPTVEKLPRRCSLSSDKIPLLAIEHFKYTWGVEAYLEDRIQIFQKNRIAWHTESSAVLAHIREHDGKICTTCKELHCRNVSSRL